MTRGFRGMGENSLEPSIGCFILLPQVKQIVRLFSLLALITPLVWAGAQTPELSADAPIVYSEETGMLIATGNALYRDENTTVQAEEIRYNRDKNQIEAYGKVEVTREGLRLLSERLFYDAGNKRFSSGKFRAGYPPLFIEGESFEGSLDEIDFSKVSLYIREPVANAPKITIREGTYVAGKHLKGSGLRLNAFGEVGIPLPPITYTFGMPSVEVEAAAGYTNSLGGYGQSLILYPFGEDWSAGGNLDFYTQRGILLGPAFRMNRNNGLFKVFLSSGWIHDHSSDDRGFDLLDKRIAQDRSFVEFGLQARDEAGHLQLQARGTQLSDSEVLRDFRDQHYLEQYHPDTYVDFTWQQSSFLLSVFARAQINDYYHVVERLPEVRGEYLPTELGKTGFYLQAAATATRYREQKLLHPVPNVNFPNSPFGSSSYPYFPDPSNPFMNDLEAADIYHRFDATTTLTRPFHGPAGTAMVLRAGGRWTTYDQREGTDALNPSDDRWMGELGVDLSQTLARTYQVDWRPFNLNRLRHQSRILAQYRWHPGGEDTGLYDRLPYSPIPPVLDLADMWNVDGLGETSVVRFGWENILMAAGENAPYRDFLKVDLYQDLVFSADPGRDEWEALYGRVDFTPVSWLSLRWLQKFNPEEFTSESSYFQAVMSSSDLWTLAFQAHYLADAIDQYELRGQYRLTENLGLLGTVQYDARLSAWTLQRYGFTRRFGNVWQMEMYVTFTDQDARRDDFSVGLRLRWLSF